MRHEAVAVGLLARVVGHEGGDEMELQVGIFEIRPALEEGAGFQALAGGDARLEKQVLRPVFSALSGLDWLCSVMG